MTTPRTVFGMPAYGRPDSLARVLESLLTQTRDDLAIVIVDDKPSPEVQAIVDRYRALDARITYEANPERLGMVGNWRRAFERARALYPGAEYFAWVSDHDDWHPRWHEALAGALDGRPEAVLAYPFMQRVFPDERRSVTRVFSTERMQSPFARLRAATTMMTAGNCIYGLFRARALEQAGVFRGVLMPDRQVLLALCLLGEFIQVPEVLWYREVAGMFSYTRQRRMFFAGRPPLHLYLPANVQHCGVLAWDFGVLGRARPVAGRLTGLAFAAVQLAASAWRETTRDDAAWREALAASALGRWAAGVAGRGSAAVSATERDA